jgi:uroporphyrinogen decarboxylase
MEAWLTLADEVYRRIQKEIVLDEIFIGEDICYNHGLLISGDMIREFLFPYYQQLLSNIKSRQMDKTRTLHFQVDTDGFSDAAIPLYQELGMDYLSPFEVASGCDVVRTAGEYPELLIMGGFDKRILAKSKADIDREINRIMPVMKKRGAYIPTCDHGVPANVSFENYLHYRKRMGEFAG